MRGKRRGQMWKIWIGIVRGESWEKGAWGWVWFWICWVSSTHGAPRRSRPIGSWGYWSLAPREAQAADTDLRVTSLEVWLKNQGNEFSVQEEGRVKENGNRSHLRGAGEHFHQQSSPRASELHGRSIQHPTPVSCSLGVCKGPKGHGKALGYFGIDVGDYIILLTTICLNAENMSGQNTCSGEDYLIGTLPRFPGRAQTQWI